MRISDWRSDVCSSDLKPFAFGADAWLLTAYLQHLALTPEAAVEGATGALRIGPEGNVLRPPLWSTFSNGYVVALGTGGCAAPVRAAPKSRRPRAISCAARDCARSSRTRTTDWGSGEHQAEL